MGTTALAVWLLSTFLLTPELSAGNQTLYILTVLPYPSQEPSLQPSWDAGTDVLPAAYLAVEMINNRSDMLPGYTLELINDDSGCNFANNARVSFVTHAVEGEKRPIIGILGPGCSTGTLAFSPLSGHSDISLLNLHLAGSPYLEDRNKYPYSIGVLGSSYGFVNASAALMNEAGWRRVGVLYDEERVFFLSTYQALEKDLTSLVEGAEIVYTSAIYDTFLPVNEIENHNIRVTIVLAGPEFVRKIMCLAMHQHLLYPRYQWVLLGRDITEFEEDITFNYLGSTFECSGKLLTKVALNGNFLVNYRLITPEETMETKSGVTYEEYLTLYKERVELYNSRQASYTAPGDSRANASVSIWATLVFDAVWALVIAMNKAESQGVNLATYALGNTEHTNIARDILYNTKFYGVSGYINFDSETGFTQRVMDVIQVFGSIEIEAGHVQDRMLVTTTSPMFVRDEFQSTGIAHVLPGVAAFFSLVTIFLVILMVIAHALSIIYRKHPAVKAQSPKLNQISYVGTYIFAVGSLIYIISRAVTLTISKEAYASTCQVIWAWCFSISFSAFFAPICARTWRLYRIFTHYLNPGPFISDPVLFTAVFVFITVDVVLAIIWTAVDPFFTTEIQTQVTDEGDYVTELGCEPKYPFVWFTLTYSLKVFILIVTIILSLLTRSIQNERFKTNSLRVLVYLFALIWVIGLTLYYSTSYLGLDIHVQYTMLVTMCISLLVLALVLIFLPPILPLLREKLGPQWNRGKKYIIHISEFATSSSNSSV